MDKRSPKAMLVPATAGFSAGIEAGYRLALHVDDLCRPADSQATVRIVPDRVECRGIERRFFDLIHGRIFPASELRIAALIDIGVPFRDGFIQVRQRTSLELMTALDLRGQFFDRIGLEEEAVG